ncbi:MAG: triose-phosphate isomerase [Candidatus Kapabacteria bacterium]|nr:triose-phosphate isomerase [Candidatus Kapabacteria bacterium]
MACQRSTTEVRSTLVVGNWKMNLLRNEALDLVAELGRLGAVANELVDVVICPPFTALTSLADHGMHGIKLGAQNCHFSQKGAYTGEVSAEMLCDVGCSYVIIGHSERRRDYNETDAEIGRKAHHALQVGLRPIICVGELLEERQSGKTLEVLFRQIDEIVETAGADVVSKSVIAYEPVWAIGTGLAATSAQVQDVHAAIRAHLEEITVSGAVPILYGGSVTAANAAGLFSCQDVDGALVGGASLKAQEFAQIVHEARQRTR